MIFDKAHYRRMGPDAAEGEIGGSVLSELLEDTSKFPAMPDDYDFVYYLSRRHFVSEAGNDGPSTVIAVFRENQPDQRTFTLDYARYTKDLDDEYDGNLVGDPEDWIEQ